MKRRKPGSAAETMTPLRHYLHGLERDDVLRRQGKQCSREWAHLMDAQAQTWEALTRAERAEADRRREDLRCRREADFGREDPGLEDRTRVSRQGSIAPRAQAEPTGLLPGSEGKLQELTRRRKLGLDLHAGADVRDSDDRGLETLSLRNGAGRLRATGATTVAQRGGVGTPVAPPLLRGPTPPIEGRRRPFSQGPGASRPSHLAGGNLLGDGATPAGVGDGRTDR